MNNFIHLNLFFIVPGGWGNWGNWTKCSKTCGIGIQTRKRVCDSPSPRNGGKNCTGEMISTQDCEDAPCPVDGSWSAWSLWAPCR